MRPGLPGPRRHPGAAGRRGPEAGLTGRRRWPTWFDEARLDDEAALARADPLLRSLAESGARVRREAAEAAEAIAAAVAPQPRRPAPRRDRGRPGLPAAARGARAVVPGAVRGLARPRAARAGPAGSTSSSCSLPRAPTRAPPSAVAEAVRRGCQVVVACPPGRWSPSTPRAAGRTILPTRDRRPARHRRRDARVLDRVDLGPAPTPRRWRDALDDVAVACSPHRDLAVNPAKMLAIALADTNPLVWGGSVLAARAARRVAESLRRATGRTALAGDAEHLLPVIEAAPPADVFDDPFADDAADRRPMLLVLDDGAEDPSVREQRGRLLAAAASRGVRVETVDTDADERGGALRLAQPDRALRGGLPAGRPDGLSRSPIG